MTKKFDLIVEGKSEDITKVAPHLLELNGLVWNEESPPDVIMLGMITTEGNNPIILTKVGRYLTSGDQYGYRVATVAKLVNGQLVKV
jgi:hypothetical protein